MALAIFSGGVLVTLSSLRNIAVGRYQRTQEAAANALGFIEERIAGREDVRTNAARHTLCGAFTGTFGIGSEGTWLPW